MDAAPGSCTGHSRCQGRWLRPLTTGCRGNLDRLDIDDDLQTWQSLRGHAPEELTADTVDLLFVGGGNTFRLLDAVRSHGFVDQVRRFWSAGGDYYGGSAGAVLACESIAIAVDHDSNDPGLVDLTGLGLLPDVTVLPHFTDDQLESATQWASQYDAVVMGVPETVGLRVNPAVGEATVIGSGALSLIVPTGRTAISAGRSFELPHRQ